VNAWLVLAVPVLVLLVVLLFAFTGCESFGTAPEPPVPPSVPLSRVQAQTGAAKGSVTAVWSPATTLGGLLVAVVSTENAPDLISGSPGWVQAVAGPNKIGPRVEIWYYANNPGGRTSETFTCTNATSSMTLDIREYAGAATTDPLDKYAGNGDDKQRTAVSTGAAGPVAPSGVAVAGLCNRNAATAQGPPTNGHATVSDLTEGQGLRTQGTEKLGGLSQYEQTGTTLAAARPWSAVVAVFKSASV
jgi:hypothetical protein